MMNSVKLNVCQLCKCVGYFFFEITDGLEALTLCYASTWYMSIYYPNAYIIPVPVFIADC